VIQYLTNKTEQEQDWEMALHTRH